MVLLSFSGIDLAGNYREYSYGGQSLESCFESLSFVVRSGWQLTSVKLLESSDKSLSLPTEAFDGAHMQEWIERLQQEWEEVLYQQ